MVIRLGIIGLSTDPAAWATLAHIGPLKQKPLSDQYKLMAVATSSSTSAKAAAKAYDLPENKAYDSSEAIAQDDEVDMVVVSVNVPHHYQLTLPALKAGKSVFVEWPLGSNLAQAEEMAALAKTQGVKTAVGLQARAAPFIQKAKEIIASGVLGRIVTTTLVASSSVLTDVPEKYHYLNKPNSGASIVSIPVLHTLDPLCYLLGEFKWLSANLATNFPNVQMTKKDGTKSDPIERIFHDSISIQGMLESGPSISFVFNCTTPGTPDHIVWIISGEKGSLKFEGDHAAIQMASTKLSIYEPATNRDGVEFYGDKNVMAWKDVDVPAPIAFGGVGEVYQAFAEGNQTLLVDFDEAVKRHRMVDAIFRSAEKGTRESY